MKKIVIAGGGAAGFFAAIAAAEADEEAEVILLEKSPNVLGKVKVSGGGRCNVTHACFDPSQLVKYYPRGEKALRGPFQRFNASHTVEWFESRGVPLKTEADGRMFPTTDSSETIMDCLVIEAKRLGVRIWTQHGLENISFENGKWQVITTKKENISADKVMIATGSSNKIWEKLQQMGYSIEPPVPSLFTFNIKDRRINGLQGISVPEAEVAVQGTKLKEKGPLLITHWGMSGPAILRLSAWGARILSEMNYDFQIKVNLIPATHPDAFYQELMQIKQTDQKKQPVKNPMYHIPSRWWERLATDAGMLPEQRWADINKKTVRKFSEYICAGIYSVQGKSTFKEEFVTCGGISLHQVDLKTGESKLHPGLYFAGEVLDIDAITGGFNFQAAWTMGYICGRSMGA